MLWKIIQFVKFVQLWYEWRRLVPVEQDTILKTAREMSVSPLKIGM
jgi:hypothetical protein